MQEWEQTNLECERENVANVELLGANETILENIVGMEIGKMYVWVQKWQTKCGTLGMSEKLWRPNEKRKQSVTNTKKSGKKKNSNEIVDLVMGQITFSVDSYLLYPLNSWSGFHFFPLAVPESNQNMDDDTRNGVYERDGGRSMRAVARWPRLNRDQYPRQSEIYGTLHFQKRH